MLGWALLVKVGLGVAGEFRQARVCFGKSSWGTYGMAGLVWSGWVSYGCVGLGKLGRGRQVMVRPVELGLVVDWFGRRG